MITNIGKQILSELKSEQAMDVADKKWWFVFKEFGSIPHFICHFLKAFSASLFVYPTAIMVLSVALLDEQGLQLLLSQPLSEIIQIKRELIYLSFLIMTFYLVFFYFSILAQLQEHKATISS